MVLNVESIQKIKTKMNLQWSRLVLLYYQKVYIFVYMWISLLWCTHGYCSYVPAPTPTNTTYTCQPINKNIHIYITYYVQIHACTYVQNHGWSYVHTCWCTSDHSFVKTPKLATSFDLFLHSPHPLQFAPSL